MRLTVNGKPRDLALEASAKSGATPLLDVLHALAVNPRLVAVAINGDVIEKQAYADTAVHDGEVLEIVRMVGGGS